LPKNQGFSGRKKACLYKNTFKRGDPQHGAPGTFQKGSMADPGGRIEEIQIHLQYVSLARRQLQEYAMKNFILMMSQYFYIIKYSNY